MPDDAMPQTGFKKNTSGLVSIHIAYMSGSQFQPSHITSFVCSIQP